MAVRRTASAMPSPVVRFGLWRVGIPGATEASGSCCEPFVLPYPVSLLLRAEAALRALVRFSGPWEAFGSGAAVQAESGGHRSTGGPFSSVFAGPAYCGPGTVIEVEFDSFRPSVVQMAPLFQPLPLPVHQGGVVEHPLGGVCRSPTVVWFSPGSGRGTIRPTRTGPDRRGAWRAMWSRCRGARGVWTRDVFGGTLWGFTPVCGWSYRCGHLRSVVNVAGGIPGWRQSAL